MTNMNRRSFIGASSLMAGAVATSTIFQNLVQRCAAAKEHRTHPGYGPLAPVNDETTGLPLICLPAGFTYKTFSWAKEPMPGGDRTPALHDGMGIIHNSDSRITLCRNHEIKAATGSFADESITYDPKGAGGCTKVHFDPRSGRFTGVDIAIGGTVNNCAGGATPWGSWLTCEEYVVDPGDLLNNKPFECERPHGYIFEVPAQGKATAEPLKDMGRFVHEAVAVDPETKIVYETEDRTTAGFYRFTPNEPGRLAAGGKLEMLKVKGKKADLRKGLKPGDTFDVEWVTIDDPDRGHSPGTQDSLGVYKQGLAKGGATFDRLEGCWCAGGMVYIVSTEGGDADKGQIFVFDIQAQTLRLIFESPGKKILDSPDNMTVSPRSGALVLCEDGTFKPQRLHGLTTDGRLFPFAANNVILDGKPLGLKRDYRGEEWAGSTFSADGQWLFVNNQTPGFTVAITGPWDNGPLGSA